MHQTPRVARQAQSAGTADEKLNHIAAALVEIVKVLEDIERKVSR